MIAQFLGHELECAATSLFHRTCMCKKLARQKLQYLLIWLIPVNSKQ